MAKKSQDPKSKHHPPPRRGIRSFWSGTISFGLVNVPVHLFPANRNVSVSLRMLDPQGTPLSRRYFCPEHQRDVHPEHILRGYPVDEDAGEYVIVRDDELQALEPKKSREIDLRRFVNLDDISPMFYERAYYLTPGGDTNKAYRLLAAVMEASGKAGIATFVMRDREYLIAILAENGILRAQTMRFADELRTPEYVGLPEPAKPSRSEIAAVDKVLKKNTQDELNSDLLKDDFAQRLKRLVEQKLQAHQDVVKDRVPQEAAPKSEDDEEEEGIDLLESIRRSLRGESDAASKRNGSHRNSRDGSRDGSRNSSRNGTSRTKGSGSSKKESPLDDESKEELYERAKALKIPGRSKLSKEELIHAIRKANR